MDCDLGISQISNRLMFKALMQIHSYRTRRLKGSGSTEKYYEGHFHKSNVYLLPSATQMTIADIYDLVVPKRRPNSQKSGNETPVKIGDNATIIQITNSCGDGYVLILEQSNVVVCHKWHAVMTWMKT